MDRQTFTDMALAEMDAVYRLAVYLSSRHDADDLVQDTYVRAFRSMDTFELAGHGIRPWLFKILHNVVYDRSSEDQKRRATLDGLREEQETSSAAGPLDGVPVSHELDWEQVDDRLRAAIEALPLHHRSVFLLSAIEGLRYREIAEIADIPIGTVMSRLCRARAILAAQLSEFASELRLHPRSAPRDERAPLRLETSADASAADISNSSDRDEQGGSVPA